MLSTVEKFKIIHDHSLIPVRDIWTKIAQFYNRNGTTCCGSVIENGINSNLVGKRVRFQQIKKKLKVFQGRQHKQTHGSAQSVNSEKAINYDEG